MAGITQYLAILNSVARSFLAGSDANGTLSPAHTLVDQNGVPVSTAAPLPVSDAALTTANGYLATLASEDAGLATATLQTTGNASLASIIAALAAVPIVPPVMRGQGTLAVSTSSIAISSLTKTANSAAFPTGALGGTVRVKNAATSASGVYVSWLGGTASDSGCEYIAPGESQTKYLPAQNMTTASPAVVAVSSATIECEW